jgi:polysaccharide deacetylase family protein (PEP-CTERM system associated)
VALAQVVRTPQIVLSFDVEEHHRIEAAAGLRVPTSLQAHYAERMDVCTRWLLDQLDGHGCRATFFVVGQIARDNPALVRAIHRAGHEVASHSWEHRRIHTLTRETFREDVRKSKDALEQVTGEAVVGYRAPTFSIVRQTAWALDVLAEEGFLYDSSIYPVRHDRYGVPGAPRVPFRACGGSHSILELPPATLRCFGINVPTGGGGYFRLFPLSLIERTIRQIGRQYSPAVVTLYFHPWEFDREQERLPLGLVGRFRTYTGISRSRDRLGVLLSRGRFVRAREVAERLTADEEGPLLARLAIGDRANLPPSLSTGVART